MGLENLLIDDGKFIKVEKTVNYMDRLFDNNLVNPNAIIRPGIGHVDPSHGPFPDHKDIFEMKNGVMTKFRIPYE